MDKHILFIHSSVVGYLGCFHIVANLKNAAENTCILHCVCFQFP